MYNRFTDRFDLPEKSRTDLEIDTARWTSPAYDVQFGYIAEIAGYQHEHDSFRVSAWGISSSLCDLLSTYKPDEIYAATDWLVIRQNAHVVVMLDQAMNSEDFNFEMLDQVFISIDVELFLPRGLRMHVTCITNIVQLGNDSQMLDKFVAVLDPGEAKHYVRERRGMSIANTLSTIH